MVRILLGLAEMVCAGVTGPRANQLISLITNYLAVVQELSGILGSIHSITVITTPYVRRRSREGASAVLVCLNHRVVILPLGVLDPQNSADQWYHHH